MSKLHFDFIMMDVRMPDLNGVEPYRRIKTFAPDTRVIMMSAYALEELKREVLAEGAIAFLSRNHLRHLSAAACRRTIAGDS